MYLAYRTKIKVMTIYISAAHPRFAGSIDVAAPPNGLAVAPELHRLYAGLSGGTLAVIDTQADSPRYMQAAKSITGNAAAESDLMDYSPSLQRDFASPGPGGAVAGASTV